MGAKRSWLVHVLAVAAAYYVAGKLALTLAIPPGYATAVWPAAGVALGAMLLWGYRIWPGILIGSFLVNIGTSLHAGLGESLARPVGLALCIAVGATLQALVASFLARRYAPYPNSLELEKEVGSLFLMGGLIGSVVSPSVGVSALLTFGLIRGPDCWFSWWTWPTRQSQLFDCLAELVGGHETEPARTEPKPSRALSRKLRILLAEDNAVNRKVALRYFEKLGCQAHSVENGKSAVEEFFQSDYDVSLMDCQMPEMDGYEATAAIREREAREGRKRVPIIAMTANAMQGDRESCLKAGMDDYVPKPVTWDALRAALHRQLGV